MKLGKEFIWALIVAFSLVSVSCDDDNSGGGDGNGTGTVAEQPAIYVIDPTTATAVKGLEVEATSIAGIGKLSNGSAESYIVAASTGEAAILLQPSSLDEGSISIINNGLETETATTWWFHSGGEYLYRLVYNQGNAGVTSSFELNSKGVITERSMTYQGPRFTTYGSFGDYIVTASSTTTSLQDSEGNYEYGILFGMYNVESQELKTITPSVENMLDNGEYVTISGIQEVNGKIYTGVVPLGISDWAAAAGVDTVGVDNILEPNKVWVAVYDGVQPDGSNFNAPTKIIEDDRLSYASSRYRSQFYSNIALGENNYLYVFSSSYNDETTKPSGVIRLNTNTNEFDEDFYINIEQLSGGLHMFKVWYVGNDYFLLQMYASDDMTTTAQYRLAILNATNKTFNWISGLPEINNIGSYGFAPYVENGRCYMPIVHATNE